VERIHLSQDRKIWGWGAVVSTRNIVVQLVHQIFGLADDELAAHEGLWSMEVPTTIKRFTFSVSQVHADLTYWMLKWCFEQGLRRINGRTLVTSTVDSVRSSLFGIIKTLSFRGIKEMAALINNYGMKKSTKHLK